ncbi:SHOCT domain-containing protein [Halomicrobium katesii]|uniref:SHOCT domain-containing protein n=1 Tax=Halomicrobium katesii TaxID=437163 RepID=UPI00036CB014|nr:SHOCT domain-containing protein [Halomicrobium katesii]
MPAAVVGFFGLVGNLVAGFLLLVPALAMLYIAAQLTVGVVKQANDAPKPRFHDERDDAAETPAETLRRRYAEGELSHEEFRQRLDHLLDTETSKRAADERDRLLE